MAAPTNFLQWNPSRVNQQSDSSYNADAQRSGGAITGIFPSDLANKLYYQISTMVAALATVMVNKGYEMQDVDVSALIVSLSNILTKAEFGTGPNTVCQGNDDRLNEPGTKMWFYQNTAPTGWTIDATPADAVLAVKGGTGAYNVNGGTQQGTWTQPTHSHTGPSHTHTTGDHVLSITEMPSHNHTQGAIYTTHQAGTEYQIGITVAGNTGFTGGGAAHNHGATGSSGTGNTSSSGVANTWRPLAQVGIICTKN